MLIAFTWLLLAGVLGTTAFFVAGVVAAVVAGGGVRDRIGRWYIDMGQAAFRNSALVVRETGSLALTTVSRDPKFGGDSSTINGVAGHWKDPLGVKSKLSGKEFGIGLEAASCYISPRAAEFGKEGARRLQSGALGVQTTPDGSEQVVLDFSVPEAAQVVDLRHAGKFLKGSCKRRWGELGNKWAEHSQEKFHENFSLGQSLLWIGAFAAGVGLGVLVMRYGTGGGGGGVEVPIQIGLASLALIPRSLDDVRDLVTSTRAQLAYLAVAALVVAVGLVAVAWSLYGLWSGVATIVGLVGGVTAPWIYVRVLFTPAGREALGSAFFILGQLTFGAGALVKRQDGAFEWGRLREDEHGLFMRLKSGRRVPIDGDRDALPSVAWAPLAATEEKTEQNMREFTVDKDTFATVRPDPQDPDGDGMVDTPLALADGGRGWHLDASKLETWARGTADSELPRNGRRKAFEEKGGEQRISQLVTMIGAGALAIVGFVLAVGALML
jgi:hypothetical protein